MWVNVTAVATAFLLLTSTSLAQTQSSACGPLENAYGPYDYRTDKAKLPIVLGAHFTPEVEALIRGATSTRPGHDIDYTLRAIPNNPRALYSMMQLDAGLTGPFGFDQTIRWFACCTPRSLQITRASAKPSNS
jgi:hypothetical protein